MIIFFSFLFAKDYFISFQIITKNNSLIFYKLNCTKALTTKNKSSKLIFTLLTNEDEIDNICKYHKEKILQKLLSHQVVIYSQDEINKYSLTTISKLTYPPKRFDIILKNGIAYFYLKE